MNEQHYSGVFRVRLLKTDCEENWAEKYSQLTKYSQGSTANTHRKYDQDHISGTLWLNIQYIEATKNISILRTSFTHSLSTGERWS